MHYAPVLTVIVVLCYLIGSVPFGLIAGRLAGIDIRRHGSGNIGATNVWRVLGRKWGLPVFLLDVGKGLAAALLAKSIASAWHVTIALPHMHSEVVTLEDHYLAVGGVIGAMAAIIGHNFPIWLKFKGGKGVATSLGVLFGLMPIASTLTFITWLIVLKLTRYVSLASIIGALSLPLWVLMLFIVPLPYGMRGELYFYFTVVATILLILRHTANIKRLLSGTERRLGEPKEPPVEPISSQPVVPPAGGIIDAPVVPPPTDPRAD